jgi:uncharacterized glyoxalase superfamily protein PhnB
MRNHHDAKAMAHSLREALGELARPVSHSEGLELIARAFGCADWNVLSAAIKAEATPPPDPVQLSGAIPIIRIFSVEKAMEFYVGFLGFKTAWTHQRADASPQYIQVTRSGLTLHLTEHHGDASPGATVFVATRGLNALHRELGAKDYPFMRPGIEQTDYGHRQLQVWDPFGNRLRFSERVEAA